MAGSSGIQVESSLKLINCVIEALDEIGPDAFEDIQTLVRSLAGIKQNLRWQQNYFTNSQEILNRLAFDLHDFLAVLQQHLTERQRTNCGGSAPGLHWPDYPQADFSYLTLKAYSFDALLSFLTTSMIGCSSQIRISPRSPPGYNPRKAFAACYGSVISVHDTCPRTERLKSQKDARYPSFDSPAGLHSRILLTIRSAIFCFAAASFYREQYENIKFSAWDRNTPQNSHDPVVFETILGSWSLIDFAKLPALPVLDAIEQDLLESIFWKTKLRLESDAEKIRDCFQHKLSEFESYVQAVSTGNHGRDPHQAFCDERGTAEADGTAGSQLLGSLQSHLDGASDLEAVDSRDDNNIGSSALDLKSGTGEPASSSERLRTAGALLSQPFFYPAILARCRSIDPHGNRALTFVGERRSAEPASLRQSGWMKTTQPANISTITDESEDIIAQLKDLSIATHATPRVQLSSQALSDSVAVRDDGPLVRSLERAALVSDLNNLILLPEEVELTNLEYPKDLTRDDQGFYDGMSAIEYVHKSREVPVICKARLIRNTQENTVTIWTKREGRDNLDSVTLSQDPQNDDELVPDWMYSDASNNVGSIYFRHLGEWSGLRYQFDFSGRAKKFELLGFKGALLGCRFDNSYKTKLVQLSSITNSHTLLEMAAVQFWTEKTDIIDDVAVPAEVHRLDVELGRIACSKCMIFSKNSIYIFIVTNRIDAELRPSLYFGSKVRGDCVLLVPGRGSSSIRVRTIEPSRGPAGLPLSGKGTRFCDQAGLGFKDYRELKIQFHNEQTAAYFLNQFQTLRKEWWDRCRPIIDNRKNTRERRISAAVLPMSLSGSWPSTVKKRRLNTSGR